MTKTQIPKKPLPPTIVAKLTGAQPISSKLLTVLLTPPSSQTHYLGHLLPSFKNGEARSTQIAESSGEQLSQNRVYPTRRWQCQNSYNRVGLGVKYIIRHPVLLRGACFPDSHMQPT